MTQNMNEIVDILMVDDRPDGLLAMEALLTDPEKYRLVKANSGLEALALVEQYDFAVILMDVQMPEVDGFQAARLIRQKKAYVHIPIIFVTAINKDDRYVYQGYESGAVDYIFKPFDPLILTSKVAVFADLHLQKRKVRWQAEELARNEALLHRSYIQSLEFESLKRYQNLADAIPHIVWRASSEGTVDYYNQLWSSYTGMSLEQSLGTGWQEAFNSYDLRILLTTWSDAIHEARNFETECRIRRHDGVYRWHWIKGVPEKNSDGQVIAWLGTCTDIQDRKSFEKKVVEAQKNAEAASLAKSQFLANMSHEIRTPLSAIMGFTELMMDEDATDDEKNTNLQIVRRNGQQLLKIIDEILDISKVEAGRLETENEVVNLVDLMSGIESLMEVQANAKGIDLKIEIDQKIPDCVRTDETRLRQILINVIGNAIKFTHDGEVRVTVTYGMNEEGLSLLKVLIQDTGIGLDPKAEEQLFTPFHQADTSTTRLYGGTGLGLALSRQLARALGGDVWLDRSELGQGSTFVVQINAEPTECSVWVKSLREAQKKSRGPQKSEQRELEGAKILLVEDAEDNQVLISHFLARAGAEIDMASNGQEGIQKALANEYTAVLMDIQMPFVDGYEATTQLRQAGYLKPIIALTAHALREEREKALQIGCDGHLTKPIDRVQLIENLKKFV